MAKANVNVENIVEDNVEEINVEEVIGIMEGKEVVEEVVEAVEDTTSEVVGEAQDAESAPEAADVPENDDASVAAENDPLNTSVDEEAFTYMDAALFAKYANRMEGAAQLQHAQLPSIAYFSKAPFCDLINQLKRSNDYSEANYDQNLELLEMAIAYLYKRKHNL